MEVEDGKFVALLGPSGCGKTTTLRIVAGLETPSSGEVYFDKELVNDVPTEKRDVAMVFQFYAIYPDMSVFDNIAFPLKMQKMSKQEIDRRVKEAAERVRITHPFHPLRGLTFRFVVAKQLWGEDRITFEHPDGSLHSVPVGWTDFIPADPYLSIGGGRSHFRIEDLLALVDLVAARATP